MEICFFIFLRKQSIGEKAVLQDNLRQRIKAATSAGSIALGGGNSCKFRELRVGRIRGLLSSFQGKRGPLQGQREHAQLLRGTDLVS